jgi:hypothetical protein
MKTRNTFAKLDIGTVVNYRDMANDFTAEITGKEVTSFGINFILTDKEDNSIHHVTSWTTINEKNYTNAGWKLI